MKTVLMLGVLLTAVLVVPGSGAALPGLLPDPDGVVAPCSDGYTGVLIGGGGYCCKPSSDPLAIIKHKDCKNR
jgi:hypothetical protein